jgi:hypothetical protein
LSGCLLRGTGQSLVADARAFGDADLRLDDVDAGDLSVTVCSTWMRGFTSMK